MVDQRLLYDLAETMFASDERGRLIGQAPHFHVLRTPRLLICRCHADLVDKTADTLVALAMRPRGRPSEWSREYADYAKALVSAGPVKAIRAGPLYSFPELHPSDDEAIKIIDSNVDLLLGGLDEWRPNVAADLPVLAMVVDGRAVSICASVRASKAAHCAGLETLPEYRGRGLAARVVASWARTVQISGISPFYATTFDNTASQRVAKRLGLCPIGSEFSIECETR